MATLAEQILQGAQASAGSANEAGSKAIDAYNTAQNAQLQRQQLETQKDHVKVAKAQTILSSLDNALKFKGKNRALALKSVQGTISQVLPELNPDILEMLKDDDNATAAFRAVAQKVRGGGISSPEDANHLLNLFAGDTIGAMEYLQEQGKAQSNFELAGAQMGAKQSNFNTENKRQDQQRFTDYSKSVNQDVQNSFTKLNDSKQSLRQSFSSIAEIRRKKAAGVPDSELESLQSATARSLAKAFNSGALTDADVADFAGGQGVVGKSAEWIRKNILGGTSEPQLKRLETVIIPLAKVLDQRGQDTAKQIEPRFTTPEFQGRDAELRRASGIDEMLKSTLPQNAKSQDDGIKATVDSLRSQGKSDAEITQLMTEAKIPQNKIMQFLKAKAKAK